MTTATTASPTESARATFRAHRARIARRPLPVAGLNESVWDVLQTYRPLFTLYDVMEVAQLGKAHAIIAIRRGIAEKRVKVTPLPGRYLAVKAPCMALVPVTDCRALVPYHRSAPQFAHNFLLRVWEATAPAEYAPARIKVEMPF